MREDWKHGPRTNRHEWKDRLIGIVYARSHSVPAGIPLLFHRTCLSEFKYHAAFLA